MLFPEDAADRQGVEVHAPWRLLRRGHAKVAFSIKELVGLTSEFSIKHAPNCSSTVIRTEATKFLLVYKVTCRESYSDPAGHTVRLKFDFNRMQKSGSANDLDVRVSCSCPAFLWWGAQWNLSTGDALYGAPRPKLQPPTEARRYQNVICKHVKVVANRIGPVLERMLGVHLTKKDEEAAKEQDKQISLVKERTQQEVEQKQKEKDDKHLPPVTPVLPDEDEDLDAMPEDLGDLGLPAKPKKQYIPDKVRELLHLPPITPKVKEPEPPAAEEPAAPEEPIAPADLLQKKPRAPRKPKAPAPEEEEGTGTKRRRMLPSNIKLVDEGDEEDEDDTVTLLPGSKAQRMLKPEHQDLGDVDYLPAKKKPEPGSKAKRMVTPKPGKPKGLPPNIKLIDDDSDDEITKINRLKHASALVLAAEA